MKTHIVASFCSCSSYSIYFCHWDSQQLSEGKIQRKLDWNRFLLLLLQFPSFSNFHSYLNRLFFVTTADDN